MGGRASTLRLVAKQCGISCASFCNVNDDALLFPRIKTVSFFFLFLLISYVKNAICSLLSFRSKEMNFVSAEE